MDLQTILIYFINDGILAEKSPATLKGYEYSIRNFFHYTKMQFLPQDASVFTEETLKQFFIYGIKVRKWTKHSHWTVHKNLNVFFAWCAKKKIIESNPLENIQKPKLPQQPPKSLNEQDAIMMLRAVSNMHVRHYFTLLRNKAVIATFLFAGLRKSELINLKYTDVDLINGLILVEYGKGGKSREIPIEEAVLKPILAEYWEYREKLGKTSKWFFNGTFINRGEQDNKLAVTTINRLFKTISILCKKRIYAHKIRHTFATLMLEKGADIYTLQQLMGHASISMTTIYLSSTRAKKIEAINKMKLDI